MVGRIRTTTKQYTSHLSLENEWENGERTGSHGSRGYAKPILRKKPTAFCSLWKWIEFHDLERTWSWNMLHLNKSQYELYLKPKTSLEKNIKKHWASNQRVTDYILKKKFLSSLRTNGCIACYSKDMSSFLDKTLVYDGQSFPNPLFHGKMYWEQFITTSWHDGLNSPSGVGVWLITDRF